MAINIASATFNGLNHHSSYNTPSAPTYKTNFSGVTLSVGYESGMYESWYSTGIFKLTTPYLSGRSEYLTVSLAIQGVIADSVPINYALCTSDANYQKYYGVSGDVSDENQLTTGTINITKASTGNTFQFNIPIAGLASNREYYLFLWSSTGNSYVVLDYARPLATFSIGYNSGVAYINNEEYQGYIHNGGTSGTDADWDMVIPYVGNGTSYDECG